MLAGVRNVPSEYLPNLSSYLSLESCACILLSYSATSGDPLVCKNGTITSKIARSSLKILVIKPWQFVAPGHVGPKIL